MARFPISSAALMRAALAGPTPGTAQSSLTLNRLTPGKPSCPYSRATPTSSAVQPSNPVPSRMARSCPSVKVSGPYRRRRSRGRSSGGQVSIPIAFPMSCPYPSVYARTHQVHIFDTGKVS